MKIEKEIGGEKFVFEKASLRLRDLYQSMTTKIESLTDLGDDLRDIAADIEEKIVAAETKKEKRDLNREFRKTMAKFGEDKKPIIEAIAEDRIKMIEYLCEQHGYGFDKDFWYTYADINDINEIVVEVFK